MYTPIQIEAIKIFGRKDLTEGCIILGRFWYGGIDKILPAKICFKVGEGFHVTYTTMYGDIVDEEYDIYGTREDFKILGHIPHLEDLFRVAEDKYFVEVNSKYNEILFFTVEQGVFKIVEHQFPYNTTIPLLDQPNLEEIINLFK